MLASGAAGRQGRQNVVGMLDRDGDDLEQEPPITEPVPIQGIFATGYEVKYASDHVWVTFYAEHPSEFGERPLVATERQIVAKMVMTRQALEASMARHHGQRTNRKRRSQ